MRWRRRRRRGTWGAEVLWAPDRGWYWDWHFYPADANPLLQRGRRNA